MIHALLSVLLCSTFCTLALSVVYSNNLDQQGFLTGCSRAGDRDIPGFLIDEGAPTQMACASEPHRSAPWSAKIMSSSSPDQSDIAYVMNGITARPNRPLFFSFWLKTSNNGPYPTSYYMGGTMTQTFGPLSIFPIGNPISLSFSQTNSLNGWYQYTAQFTLTSTNNADPAFYRFRIDWNRTADDIVAADVWADDFLCDYLNPLITGDPQFVGLRGQSYQVHGIDGAVYNLVSSPSTQVNSRFVFLDDGKCPIFDGVPAKNCWAHAGSYLGAIGVQQIVDDVTHKLAIISGSSTQGFASVILNDEVLSINDTRAYGDFFDVIYVSSHVVMVNTADFAFTFENSDMFINQGVAANKPLSQLTSHGLFGQTHKMAVYPSIVKYIAGDIDDYVINDNDLFGEEFVYNQFHATH